MKDKHRLILRHSRVSIGRNLEPNNILSKLVTVLTETDEEEVKAQLTRQARCEKLLEILPRKGPNAFKVFVEALKEEANHLADVLIEADREGIVREQSANLRGEIRDLETKLEAEKQDHGKTSQELEELKSLHETFKTETSQQIQKLAEIVQQLTDDSCSPCEALRNLKESTERETQTSEIQELAKGITKMIEGYQTFETQQRGYRSLQKEHEKLSQELKKAKKLLEDYDKSKEAVLKLKRELEKSQKDLEEIKTDLANKEDSVKECKQKLQAKSKTIDDLNKKLKNAMENKNLQKKLGEEKSKCDTLKKEVHRLRLTSRQMPGQIYSYSEDFDKRGVVYDLATNYGKTSQVNPSSTQIVATRSSDGEGKAEDLLKNQVKRGTVSGTEEKKGSWWRVDLTEKYALYLTHYTLRHGRNRSISVLANWRLEGSIDGRKWTTLKNHEDHCGLKEYRPYCTCTWTIDGNSKAFRYFRIFQTGPNSSEKFGVFLSGIELYGVLITKTS
ncbi:uncharacterized protein [Acropora muricata]|uniref:uncharacterized protein isoform X2 n=1 Tax=Acropora muricata TaxID=159855 RepID=UPI0034E41630